MSTLFQELAVSTALDSIDAAAERMAALKHDTEVQRVRRNNLIRNAADNGVKHNVLMRRAKLSRQQITTIVNTPAEEEPRADQ